MLAAGFRIDVDQVGVSFNQKPALRDVSVQVPAGRRHVLLGLSGSGKTTLLRAIMGLVRPDRGTIRVGDQSSDSLPPREWVRRFGYMPQESGLFPHLSAYQNVTLVARTLGWTETRLQARVSELQELASIDQALLNRYPHELSGGQRQRMSLMRAAFLNPPVLILDEPLGALDPITRSELQTELLSAFERLQKTVLLVTHDLGEAARLGQSVSLLNEGRVIQTGILPDLIERPANDYVRRFVRAQAPVRLTTESAP